MLDRLSKQAISFVMLRKHATRVLRKCRQVGRVARVRFNGLLKETRVFIQRVLLHTRPEHSIASEHTRVPAPARRESTLKDLLRCRVLLNTHFQEMGVVEQHRYVGGVGREDRLKQLRGLAHLTRDVGEKHCIVAHVRWVIGRRLTRQAKAVVCPLNEPRHVATAAVERHKQHGITAEVLSVSPIQLNSSTVVLLCQLEVLARVCKERGEGAENVGVVWRQRARTSIALVRRLNVLGHMLQIVCLHRPRHARVGC